MEYELGQVNVARLGAPLEDPRLADFVAALEPVNALADESAGFVWRLQTLDGNATSITAFEWDAAGSVGMIVNMSVWVDVEHLAAFVYGPLHREVLRRRRDWFEPMGEAYTACWWVPTGVRPTTADAEQRVRQLRELGPTSDTFTMRTHYPPPRSPELPAADGRDS